MSLRKLFYIYILIILLLAFLPLGMPKIHLDDFNIHLRLDYFFHFVLYIPWIFLAVHGIQLKTTYAILFGILLGAGTEVVQYYLSYRAFNINDIISNLIGILLGLVFILPLISQKLLKLRFIQK